MKTCSIVLTFESVDKILWCDHSNETASAVLFHRTIYISIVYKMTFWFFGIRGSIPTLTSVKNSYLLLPFQ